MDRREILKLPVEERRRLLEEQAARPEVQAFYEPHSVTEAYCDYCAHRWTAVHPVAVPPDALECPKCSIHPEPE